MQSRHFIALAALCMLLAVAAGAFGAHALRAVLSADLLAVWQTAVLYQMVHGLGLLAIGILLMHTQATQATQATPPTPQRLLRWSGVAMLLGIVLFSGSLYLLALTGIRGLGAITPFGGLAFLFAWGCLAWWAWRASVV
jgi:uncharacterized membrane protein YgdD (TMEM256/DUF423 family)